MDNTDEALRRLLMKVGEVAEELRLSRSTTYRLIREGPIPAVHVGGSARVPTKALVDKLVRSRTP